MKSIVNPVSLPADMRNYLASVQDVRETFEAAMDHPNMLNDPHALRLRDAMNAMVDFSIEQIREVHQRLERARALERQLPALAEQAGFDAARRHMSALRSRRILFAVAMMGFGAASAIGGVLTVEYITARSKIEVTPTCVDQPDGSKVCSVVIPPAIKNTRQ
jgi:adenine/guanine phosphoribosyltransferase-like PRPP-binding protein